MSFVTSMLETVGINSDTGSEVSKFIGVDSIVQSSLPVVQAACKQGTTIAIKDYAIPVTAGMAIIVVALIMTGVGIEKYAAGHASRRKKK